MPRMNEKKKYTNKSVYPTCNAKNCQTSPGGCVDQQLSYRQPALTLFICMRHIYTKKLEYLCAKRKRRDKAIALHPLLIVFGGKERSWWAGERGVQRVISGRSFKEWRHYPADITLCDEGHFPTPCTIPITTGWRGRNGASCASSLRWWSYNRSHQLGYLVQITTNNVLLSQFQITH